MNFDKTEVQTKVMTLEPATLQKLSAQIAQIEKVELKDTEPSREADPMCGHAPMITYTVIKNTEEIAIKEFQSCKTYANPEANKAYDVAYEFLNSVYVLAIGLTQ